MEMPGTETNFIRGKTLPVLISCVPTGVDPAMVKLDLLADRH